MWCFCGREDGAIRRGCCCPREEGTGKYLKTLVLGLKIIRLKEKMIERVDFKWPGHLFSCFCINLSEHVRRVTDPNAS